MIKRRTTTGTDSHNLLAADFSIAAVSCILSSPSEYFTIGRLLPLKPWQNRCLLLNLCWIGEGSGEISPFADMLLVTLFDTGVDVLRSRKNTSSLVDDVRLTVSSNQVTLLKSSESWVSILALSHSRDEILESSDCEFNNLLVRDFLAVEVIVARDESDTVSLNERLDVCALTEFTTLPRLLLE